MMAPFFSSFTSLFYLSSFFFPLPLTVEVLSPLVLPVSRKAFRLLLEVLVLRTFFLLLVEVSTRVLIEQFMELPRVDTLLVFFEEVELDFFILLLY